MNNFLSILIVFVFFACGQATTEKPTTDIPDTPTGNPGTALSNIVEYYNDSFVELGPISYHENWDKWLVGTEATFARYADYAKYQADNPFDVTVDMDNGYLQVKDEGTGGGTFTVTATLFKKADGSYLFARTEVASSAEETDTELFFASYENGKMVKEAIPLVKADAFFTDKKEVALKYPLVSVIYTLPRQGTDFVVNVSPNYPYHCKNGKFDAAASLKADEVKEICAAWGYFEEREVRLKWNGETGKFGE